MRTHRGLTLAEIVVALGVLTALSLVVVAIFTRLLVSSTKNSDQTTANLLARSILDRAVRQGPPDWGTGGDFSTAGGTATLSTNDTTSKTGFVYQVTPVRLTTPDSFGFGELYEVTVIVSWWTDSADKNASREGYGRTSVEVTRTVYIRE